MRLLRTLGSYLAATSLLAAASSPNCKCTPDTSCWPTTKEWTSLNTTLSGALLRGIPPASVCYPTSPNYSESQCAIARDNWFNSSWHLENPISTDYPIWANNSCNPIFPNGTSVTGDVYAGKKGCSIGNYPVYVVNATRAEHVSEAFKWAGKKGIRVIVKSTGHSFPGRSIGYGSLSIWTHNFRGISYLPSFRPTKCPIDGSLMAARVAAGHTDIEVQSEMAKHNAIVVTGNNPDVGIVGWLTGGGHGPLSTTYGMGADNLLEATIVTPDGKILLANPCVNTDIFFAIRGGGGGTFGVVTEVVLKAFPTPKATLHNLKIGSLSPAIVTEYWDLIGFLHSEMQRLKEGGLQGYYILAGPPSVPTLSFAWSFSAYDKANGTVEKLVKPITDYLDARPSLFIYSSEFFSAPTYWELNAPLQNYELVAQSGAAMGSRFLSPESLANASVTARIFEKIGMSNDAAHPSAPYLNPLLLGHMIASPNTPSYYPSVISMNPAWRRTLTHFVVAEGWSDAQEPTPQGIKSVYDDITYNKTEPLRKLSPNTGAYFNEADSYEPDWQKAFFGENYARLRKIKEKVDPTGILWCRRCVGSEDWVEQKNGGLCRAGAYGRRDGNEEISRVWTKRHGNSW